MRIIGTTMDKKMIKFAVADEYGNKQVFCKSLMTIEPQSDQKQLLLFASGLKELGNRLEEQVKKGSARCENVDEFGRKKVEQTFCIENGMLNWKDKRKTEYLWLKVYKKKDGHTGSMVESHMLTEAQADRMMQESPEGPDEMKAIGPFYDPATNSFGDYHAYPSFRPKFETRGRIPGDVY